MTAKATAAAFGDSRSASSGSPRARRTELRAASPAPGARADSIAAGSDIKVGHALEFVEAGFDILRRQPQQPPQAEFLDRETRHHGAVNQRPPEPPVGEVAAAREVSHEAARKAVSGARRVADLFERVSGREKNRAVLEEAGAVFTALQHHDARPKPLNRGSGAPEVSRPGEHPGLGLIDDEHIDLSQRLLQLLRLPLDPVIHGVAGHQARPRELATHVKLQWGIDVAQEYELTSQVRSRHLRGKALENIELGFERPRLAHVSIVLTSPAKRFPPRPFEAFDVNPAAGKDSQLLLAEILTHDRHDFYGCEIAGGHGEEAGGAAQDFLRLAVRRLEGIKGDRTNDEQRHLVRITSEGKVRWATGG